MFDVNISEFIFNVNLVCKSKVYNFTKEDIIQSKIRVPFYVDFQLYVNQKLLSNFTFNTTNGWAQCLTSE